jgi:hypothetical protein
LEFDRGRRHGEEIYVLKNDFWLWVDDGELGESRGLGGGDVYIVFVFLLGLWGI